jgi:hypothetical protein
MLVCYVKTDNNDVQVVVGKCNWGILVSSEVECQFLLVKPEPKIIFG